MKNLVLALVSFTAISSAHAATIQSVKCGGSHVTNDELIAKEIGQVGQTTSEMAMRALVTNPDGSTKDGAGVIESSSKMAVVMPVSGKSDSLCISESPTYITIVLKK